MEKVKKLIKNLEHKNTNVVINAIKTLGKLKDPDSIEPLIFKLKDKNYDIRKEAALALIGFNDLRVMKAFIKITKKKGTGLLIYAIYGLGYIKNPESLKTLISCFINENLRRYAFYALLKLKWYAINSLLDLLNYRDNELVAKTLELLGRMEDPILTKEILKMLVNRNIMVKEAVINALGYIKDPESVPHLIEILENKFEEFNVRSCAIDALGNIGDPRAVKPLLKLLKSKNILYNYNISIALGIIGKPALVPTLLFMKNKDDEIKKYCEKAINLMKKFHGDYLKSFPLIFCRKCFLRAKVEEVKFDSQNFKFVICRGCEKSNFFLEAKKIIGTIGRDINLLAIEKKIAYVKLWDEYTKKARNADIDELEIINASGIDYDEAIENVYIELLKDNTREKYWTKKIPVILLNNPPISQSTILFLKENFKSVKSKKAIPIYFSYYRD